MFDLLSVLPAGTLVLIGTVIFLIRYYLHKKWSYWANLNVPYMPPSVRKFGNMNQMFDKHDAFEIDLRNKKKYGSIWGFYIGVSPNITVHDPDMLRQIFIKEFASFPYRNKRLRKINGKEMNNGLTAVIDEQWKRTRASMSPTFSTSKLKLMSNIMEWCTNNTIEVLTKKCESSDGVFTAKEVFSRLSLDVICSAAFSTKVYSQDDTKEEQEIVKHAKALFEGASLSKTFVFVCFISETIEKIAAKLSFSIFPKSSLTYFRNFADFVIKEREDNPHFAKRRVDLMQLMLDTEITEKQVKNGETKGMTRDEIIGNSLLMILAGYDNTGNAMGYLAYNFAFYPETQSRVQKEIDELLRAGGKFDYDGINSLKYLDMCLNETLRLYPALLRNVRVAVRDVTINGFTFPKGSAVSIPSYALSRDPEYWSEPEAFKPDRMEDMSQIDPMMYQPFGAGPRNCIGMRFALLEVKMAIAKIVHKFTFKPAENTPKPPLKLVFHLIPRPAEKFKLRIVRRDESN